MKFFLGKNENIHEGDLSDDYVNGYVNQHLAYLQGDEAARKYREIYADHIMANALLKPNSKMLYLGCGTGGFYHLFTNVSEILGLDWSQKMAAIAANPPLKKLIPQSTKIRSVCADWTKHDFNREQFDAVWASTLSVYLPYTPEYVTKLADLTKPGGYLFVPIRIFQSPKSLCQFGSFQLRCLVKKIIRFLSPNLLLNPLPITCFGERKRVEEMFGRMCEELLYVIELKGNIVLIYRK